MPNIDPADMATRWRYRVDQDFTSRGGTPASWANDHPRFWGTEARCKVMGEYIMSASLNADSTLLALAHNDTVQVLSAKDLAVQQILRGSHGMGEVRSVAFHPHHPLRLVSEASPPDEEATLDPSCRPLISFWDLTFQGELQERGTLDGALFQDCPFNSSGSQMAYWGGEGSYEIWICSPFIDQDNMQYLGSFSAYLVCIGFATDDITLKTGQQQCCEVLAAASTDGEIQVWDARTLERKRRIQTEGRLFAAAITPSGKRLATVTINGPVKIWVSIFQANEERDLMTWITNKPSNCNRTCSMDCLSTLFLQKAAHILFCHSAMLMMDISLPQVANMGRLKSLTRPRGRF